VLALQSVLPRLALSSTMATLNGMSACRRI
jgi:hypothetical protein